MFTTLRKLAIVAVLLCGTAASAQHSVPGTIGARDYNEPNYESEKCELSGCQSDCIIAQDWLEYHMSTTWQYEGLFKITVRASSDENLKTIRLFLDDELLGNDLEFPGGTENFLDQSISGVLIQNAGIHHLRLEFPQGEMYLCSITASVDCSSEPDCIACLNRQGHCSWSFDNDECVTQSDCTDYDKCEWRMHKKDRCPAPDYCSGDDDCEVCIDKDGCGWVPQLGECKPCQYHSDYDDYECWDKWWDRDSCPFDHCFRATSCAACLTNPDCVWWYNDMECRPGDSCPLEDVDCFSKDDAVDEDIAGFCQDLDDPSCAERNTCTECVGDEKCGWLHREGAEGPLCLPASKCQEEINCYTSADFAKAGPDANADEFCEKLIADYKEDAETCAQAQGCRDCMAKKLKFFDRCKWFHRLEVAEITSIYYDCGLECNDIESWDGCVEQPETCPCVPEATCVECLSDGCGYWNEDDTKYWWRYVPLPPGGDDIKPRCYHFCRTDDYEFDRGDENCYELGYDDSPELSVEEQCADLDACDGISKCQECNAQPLPSDTSKTCVWLRDRYCAPRWACDSDCEQAGPCDPCDPNPCSHDGTCIDLGNDEFECDCADGFAGRTCEVETSDAFVYYQYEGACRKDAEGTDKGTSGKDYQEFKTEDDPYVDFVWCKGQCDGNNECTGIEWRETGCEVWNSPIKGFEEKADHDCLVKAYKRYEGACRNYASEKGSNGDEYTLYKKDNNPDLDFDWCRRQCDSDNDCTGIEYRNEGDRSHCEVWKKRIGTYEEKDDHVCLVKTALAHFYSCYLGACRTNDDWTGTGANGVEYDLYKDKTEGWCKERCSEEDDCTGYEHRSRPEDKMQCEHWRAEIKSKYPKPDLRCCTKRDGFYEDDV